MNSKKIREMKSKKIREMKKRREISDLLYL